MSDKNGVNITVAFFIPHLRSCLMFPVLLVYSGLKVGFKNSPQGKEDRKRRKKRPEIWRSGSLLLGSRKQTMCVYYLYKAHYNSG